MTSRGYSELALVTNALTFTTKLNSANITFLRGHFLYSEWQRKRRTESVAVPSNDVQ